MITVSFIIKSLLLLIPLLISIAFFTLAERKIMAAIQRRKGPNVVGLFGVLQPFSDGFKLLMKEAIVPTYSSRLLFLVAPSLTFVLSFLMWGLMVFETDDLLLDFKYSLLFVYGLSSLSVYGIIIGGWASKSKYSFLGSLRSVAQMISYEVSISLIFLIVGFLAHSISVNDIIWFQGVTDPFFRLLPLVAIIFFVSIIAETNRAPFDLPEAEAELVAGYNLEYSSILFAFYFLGEYGNILFMSGLFTILFLGGGLVELFPFLSLIFQVLIYILFGSSIYFNSGLNDISTFFCFTLLAVFVFILVRAALPRYRYDQLMSICWEFFMPFLFLFFIILIFISVTSIY